MCAATEPVWIARSDTCPDRVARLSEIAKLIVIGFVAGDPVRASFSCEAAIVPLLVRLLPSEAIFAFRSAEHRDSVARLHHVGRHRINEFQVEKDKLVFGYSYAAGRAHFAGCDDVAFPGISAHVNGEDLVVRLNR